MAKFITLTDIEEGRKAGGTLDLNVDHIVYMADVTGLENVPSNANSMVRVYGESHPLLVRETLEEIKAKL